MEELEQKNFRNVAVKTDKGKCLEADLAIPCTGLKVNSLAYKTCLRKQPAHYCLLISCLLTFVNPSINSPILPFPIPSHFHHFPAFQSFPPSLSLLLLSFIPSPSTPCLLAPYFPACFIFSNLFLLSFLLLAILPTFFLTFPSTLLTFFLVSFLSFPSFRSYTHPPSQPPIHQPMKPPIDPPIHHSIYLSIPPSLPPFLPSSFLPSFLLFFFSSFHYLNLFFLFCHGSFMKIFFFFF